MSGQATVAGMSSLPHVSHLHCSRQGSAGLLSRQEGPDVAEVLQVW